MLPVSRSRHVSPRRHHHHRVLTIPRPLPHLQGGGRLHHFLDHWVQVTKESYVIKTIQSGIGLNFTELPSLSLLPVFSVKSNKNFAEMSLHVAEMLEKDAIEPVLDGSPGFYSSMFLVPKRTGGFRPIINLKILNLSVVKEKFKMETQRAIRKALHQGEWVTSIDLKDAYFHVPVKPAARKYLRFFHDGQTYQFKALPFGLTSAPREFTRVTATVGAILHRQSINLHLYLDDWLLRAESYEQCLIHTQSTVNQSARLGFIINEPKSELVLTQIFTFLGEDFDLVEGVVRPTLEKVDKLLVLCSILRKHPLQEARFVLKVLGLMNAIADTIPLGRLHMCPLQLFLISQWSMSTQHLSHRLFLNLVFQDHLLWWTDVSNLRRGKLLHLPKETETLCTDSSLKGWGASLYATHLVQGKWDQATQDTKSINWMELKAIHRSFLHFLPSLIGKSVIVHTDNTSALYNLEKEGGTHSPPLCYIAWDILTLCLSNQIHLQIQQLTGEANVVADKLSRAHKAIPTEWTIHDGVFRAILRELGEPGLNLFATCLNHKLPVYMSPCPDPKALALDALSLD